MQTSILSRAILLQLSSLTAYRLSHWILFLALAYSACLTTWCGLGLVQIQIVFVPGRVIFMLVVYFLFFPILFATFIVISILNSYDWILINKLKKTYQINCWILTRVLFCCCAITRRLEKKTCQTHRIKAYKIC